MNNIIYIGRHILYKQLVFSIINVVYSAINHSKIHSILTGMSTCLRSLKVSLSWMPLCLRSVSGVTNVSGVTEMSVGGAVSDVNVASWAEVLDWLDLEDPKRGEAEKEWWVVSDTDAEAEAGVAEGMSSLEVSARAARWSGDEGGDEGQGDVLYRSEVIRANSSGRRLVCRRSCSEWCSIADYERSGGG